MTQSKWKRIIAGVMAAAALGLVILGVLNLPKQQGDQGKALLQLLRIRTLLNATGTQVVESYVDVAKAEARAAVKKAGGGMAALREAVAKAEEDARSKYANASAD